MWRWLLSAQLASELVFCLKPLYAPSNTDTTLNQMEKESSYLFFYIVHIPSITPLEKLYAGKMKSKSKSSGNYYIVQVKNCWL